MSIASLDLPLEIFSGYVSDIAPSDLPAGASPANQDVAFILGGWKTRPGLGTGVFAAASGNPTVNYQKTFTDQARNNRLLYLLSQNEAGSPIAAGLNQEYPYGTITPGINTIPIPPNCYGKSATAYGMEYLAFCDGQFGISDPAEWDGTNYGQVNQCGPGAGAVSVNDICFALVSIVRADTTGLITAVITGTATGITVGSLFTVSGVIADSSLDGQWIVWSVTTGGGNTTVEAWGAAGQYPIQSISRSGGTVTAILGGTPIVNPSASITIANVDDSSYDGLFTVVTVSGNTVTWAQAGTDSNSFYGTAYIEIAAIGVIIAETTSPSSGAVIVGGDQTAIFPSNGVITIAGNSESSWDGTWAIGQFIPAYPAVFLITSGAYAGNTYIQIGTGGYSAGTGGTCSPYNTSASGPWNSGSDPAISGVAGPAGYIPAGLRQCSVCFVLNNGYITKPSPPISWFAQGNFQASVNTIPTGPPNVLARLLIFTEALADPATTGPFYTLPTLSPQTPGTPLQINDNVTTTYTVNFSDTVLASGLSADYLFGLIELEESSGVVSYSSRLFWWGMRNRVPNFLNMSFNGGVQGAIGAAALPLGWSEGADFSGGGIASGWFDARWSYSITLSASAPGFYGMIQQSAYQDYDVDNILLPNTQYSMRVKLGGTLSGSEGNFVAQLYSPSDGIIATATVLGHAIVSSAGPPYDFNEYIVEFSAALPATVPTDLVLRFYFDSSGSVVDVSGVLGVNELQIFPTLTPYLQSTIRCSYAGQPNSYDEETGVIQPFFQDGQAVRSCFVLREKLYIVKDNGWYVTKDDGSNEPASWSLSVVSDAIGCCGFDAADTGEDWAILANRYGPYIFWGGIPVKIGQEIQSDASDSGKVTWDSINWDYGYLIRVRIDKANKRCLISAPVNGATTPNVIFYFDYRGSDTADGTLGQAIADHWSVKYSSYTGKMLAIGNAPKWSVWTISSNSLALIERSDGTAHTFIGNGAAVPTTGIYATGKIYDLLDANKSDDGAGIPWSYTTYLAPSHTDEAMLQIKSHRKLFTYLAGSVKGSGAMAISAQPMGNIFPTALNQYQLVNPGTSAAITSISRVSGIATVTCPAHGLTSGIDNQVNILGAGDPSFIGTFPILAIPNVNQFQIAQYLLPDLLGVAGGTASRLWREFEYTTNILGERVAWTFSNSGNAAGSWAQMEKIIWSLVPDPWSPIRGSTY